MKKNEIIYLGGVSKTLKKALEYLPNYTQQGVKLDGLGKQKIKIKKWGSQICNLTTFMLSVALLGFEK